MNAVVDRELCIGCALCIQICPEVFEMDEGSKAAVRQEVVSPVFQESCRKAAMECPISAITVV